MGARYVNVAAVCGWAAFYKDRNKNQTKHDPIKKKK